MGKIFYIMGKSSSGKDTIYKKLIEKTHFKTIVGYTTRPMRENETEGVEYHFVSMEKKDELEHQGKIIEWRCYHTVYGDWYYFTVDDGQIDLYHENYILIGTLEAYTNIRNYYGSEHVVPLYIEVEDGERLIRAIERERQQDTPKYVEMCRRFIADSEDFSEEKLRKSGIVRRFNNENLDICIEELNAVIQDESQR